MTHNQDKPSLGREINLPITVDSSTNRALNNLLVSCNSLLKSC
jgi:hypothetical protein